MGIDQLFCVIGEAGVELLAGEHFLLLEPSGFLVTDRALVGWFGLPVKRSWGVVPLSTDPLGRRWEAC
ncbi:hypothetical protein JYT71_00850 [Acidimicrobiaceae bacterium AH-315-P05]|nr:hypothetical protein [Acidimicrobiaceae bacterium AH-315-P05]